MVSDLIQVLDFEFLVIGEKVKGEGGHFIDISIGWVVIVEVVEVVVVGIV